MALLRILAFVFGFLQLGKGQDNSPNAPPLLVHIPGHSHTQYGIPMGTEGDPQNVEMLPVGWSPNQAMGNLERPNELIHRPIGYGRPPMKLQEPVHDIGVDGLKPMGWNNRPMGVSDPLRPMESIDINEQMEPFHRPMGYGKPPMHPVKPFHDFDSPKPMDWNNMPLNVGKPPRPIWDMGFNEPSAQMEWQMKPKPIAFNDIQAIGRPRPSKAVMSLLKELVNGKYRIMADALHIDAIPIKQKQNVGIVDVLPVDSIMPMFVENQAISSQIPAPDNAMASITVEGNAGIPETQIQETNLLSPISHIQQQPSLPVPNTESVNHHVVPLEVLLDEYQSLLKEIEENEKQDNKVPFEQLYQNYLTMLGKKHQKELNESVKNENTTTPSPTTTTTTTAAPTTLTTTPSPTTPAQVTTAGSTEGQVDIITQTEVPVISTEETLDFPNFNSFIQSPFQSTYGDNGPMRLPGFDNQLTNE